MNGKIESFEPKETESVQSGRGFRVKTYAFYCVVTLSVVLLSLAFAATEMFSVFFADWGGGSFLSRLF